MDTKTNTAFAVGVQGLNKTLHRLVGTALALVLAGAIGAGLNSTADAAVITSQVGSPAAEGSLDTGDTLTGGFIKGDLGWSHTAYGPITDVILSATLKIDLIDAEDPDDRLDLYVGTDNDGLLFGSAFGRNDGAPGPWRTIGLGGTASDNVIDISSDLFADIADGTFDIFGNSRGMFIWGSNRALLTITTEDPEIEISGGPTVVVPEPASLALFGFGLAGVGIARRRRIA